jgi:hypothetical protein
MRISQSVLASRGVPLQRDSLVIARELLGQFCANSSSWASPERRERLDKLADVVSKMEPDVQASFCEDHFQSAIQSELVSLGDSLAFCKALLLRGVHRNAARYAVQSIFLHQAFRDATEVSPALVMEAAVFVFVADPQGRELSSPLPFPLFCPHVIVGPVGRVRQLATAQFCMLAPLSTANIAPHWNVLARLLADDSMT